MLLSHSTSLRTAAEAVASENRVGTFVRRAALVLAGSLFVALCAHVSVSLPFTPIPFTLQPFAVLLVGMALGPAGGFAAMALYLCEGAAGMPVFTPVGLPGVARLLGPTGGYLFSYPLAAAVAGVLPRFVASGRRFLGHAAAGCLAMLLVYGCGAAWFSHLMRVPLLTAFGGTVAPFAAMDAVKVVAAAALATTLKLRDVRA